MNPSFIHHFFAIAGMAVFVGGAALLFPRAGRDSAEVRARRTLAFILLAWGAAYVGGCIVSRGAGVTMHPMSVFTLISGNLYVILTLLYPLELAHPGWITPPRVARLFLPYLVVVGFYFAGTAVWGPSSDPRNVGDLLERLGEFGIWYRFVLYLSVCFYLAYLFLHTSATALRLRAEIHGEPGPTRELTRRLRLFACGMVLITTAYLGVLVFGTTVSLTVHRIVVVVFFGSAVWHVACTGPRRAVRKSEAGL